MPWTAPLRDGGVERIAGNDFNREWVSPVELNGAKFAAIQEVIAEGEWCGSGR
jgi:hypothetical protein